VASNSWPRQLCRGRLKARCLQSIPRTILATHRDENSGRARANGRARRRHRGRGPAPPPRAPRRPTPRRKSSRSRIEAGCPPGLPRVIVATHRGGESGRARAQGGARRRRRGPAPPPRAPRRPTPRCQSSRGRIEAGCPPGLPRVILATHRGGESGRARAPLPPPGPRPAGPARPAGPCGANPAGVE